MNLLRQLRHEQSRLKKEIAAKRAECVKVRVLCLAWFCRRSSLERIWKQSCWQSEKSILFSREHGLLLCMMCRGKTRSRKRRQSWSKRDRCFPKTISLGLFQMSPCCWIRILWSSSRRWTKQSKIKLNSWKRNSWVVCSHRIVRGSSVWIRRVNECKHIFPKDAFLLSHEVYQFFSSNTLCSL